MYFLTRRYFHDLVADPRSAIALLRKSRNPLGYALTVVLSFLRFVYSEFFLNHTLTRASALAFAILMTLIPFFASIGLFLTELSTRDLEETLGSLLPFAPPVVLDSIGQFIANAQKIKGVGLTVLIFVSVGLFGSVEEAFNTIWKVPRSRSFFVRLRTFAMVMLFSPVLSWLAFYARRNALFTLLADQLWLLELLPMLIMVLVFSFFFWVVPNTRVRFSSAFLGGLLAGSLFELERQGFASYVAFSVQTHTIYGIFGILIFFLISIMLLSIFLLIGAQFAFVHQNFYPLLRAKKRGDRRIGNQRMYLAVRVLLDTLEAFYSKKQPLLLSGIVEKYELTHVQAQGLLRSLQESGFILPVNEQGGFVPAHDYGKLLLPDVLAAFENENRHISVAPDDSTKKVLTAILGSPRQFLDQNLRQLSLGQLLARIELETGMSKQ